MEQATSSSWVAARGSSEDEREIHRGLHAVDRASAARIKDCRMLGLSVLDWLILFVVLMNVIGAIGQGFFYELFSFAGVLLGYLIAAWQYPRVAEFYARYVNSQWAADIAGFLTIFVVVALLGGVAGRTARWAVREVGLRWFDRLLGGLFGFLKGVLVCTVIVIALASFSPTSPWIRDSRIAPFMLVT